MFNTRIASAAVLPLLTLVTNFVTADVVAVVSSTNATGSLSKVQVTEIFLGKVTHFPDGAPAMPIDQAEGSRARNEFYSEYAGKSPAQLLSYWAKIIFTGRGQPPKTASDSAEVKKIVAHSPGAIGYIERNVVDSSVKILAEP